MTFFFFVISQNFEEKKICKTRYRYRIQIDFSKIVEESVSQSQKFGSDPEKSGSVKNVQKLNCKYWYFFTFHILHSHYLVRLILNQNKT